MVCRESWIGSATTSHVRLRFGLTDQQCLSTFHGLLREGRGAPAPTGEQVAQLIATQEDAVRADGSLTEARRRSLLARLARARTQPMDGRTYYAASRLSDRAARSRAALDAYYDQAARDLGWSRAEVATLVARQVGEAAGNRGRVAPELWRADFAARAEHAHLPLDRHTAYALAQVEERRARALAAAATRPTVTRQPVRSQAIRSIGYDPASGRLEVEMHSHPGAPYAYRVPPDVHRELMAAPSVGGYFATRIRGNPDYQYPTAADADAAATERRCPTCGQFAGPGHGCPPRDSAAERALTEQRARAHLLGQPDATPPAPRVLDGVSHRRYATDTATVQVPNLTALRQEARQHRAIRVPVTGWVRIGGGFLVTGSVAVEHLGRGRGFAVRMEGPSEEAGRSLRCGCQQYRETYDCEHVREATGNLQALLNRQPAPARAAAGEAVATVAADLAADRAGSAAAQAAAQAGWAPAAVSYVEDMAAFQAAYASARARAAAGEPAVPYLTENATGGLGARGSGRSFGVELEFEVPGVDAGQRQQALAAIGAELHQAGLTPSPRQQSYGTAGRRGYTEEHAGCWSFERDGTVHGEIVSPIMYDEPRTWENLRRVCEIVRRHGGRPTVSTGSHVHVSAHNYDHTVENHNRLLELFRGHEDVLYRLSSLPERGRHRGLAWCSPNRTPAGGYSSITEARNGNHGHHLGLNLQSVAGHSRDHVEFRTWDGSLDPAVIQTQIKLSLGITEAAFRDRTAPPPPPDPLGSHRARNRAGGAPSRLTGEAWRADTASFRRLVDRVFTRVEDKAQATALFAVTRWQQGR